MRRSRSTAVTALVTALLLALAGGCTSGDDSSSGDGGGSAAVLPEPGGAEDSGAGGGSDDGSADTDRQVISTATASVVVDDPLEGADRVDELVAAAGGRVEERTERAGSGDDGDDAVADLVVRVPADALDGVLDDLDDVGEVESVSVTRSDVTAAAVDLDARIAALQTSVARLLTLLDDAADTQALLSVESTLADRQGQLESLQSQRAFLADQVDLSTLTVHLTPESPPAAGGGPDGFVGGLGAGWRGLLTAVGAVVVVLGVVLPWLLVAAPVAGIAWAISRRTRRRPAVATAGSDDARP
ncbi:DUF4349 domain-containing protein [Blastococcus sp. TF02A-26]|uniref:DUF4349 domain-containing protein n=1 Tax=Blastococcus sp. TF02A-26 TaxID=2250577 RepID=UPI000DE961E9|nr:DUF4349 domain-containing protein [Blastococcus sp. TF02A-26]RBY81812.1 DUF4349 domain-containing protein [Blastococcus sp. TF02A-26]